MDFYLQQVFLLPVAKSVENQAAAFIGFRLPQRDRTLIETAAHAADLSISELIRRAAIQFARTVLGSNTPNHPPDHSTGDAPRGAARGARPA